MPWVNNFVREQTDSQASRRAVSRIVNPIASFACQHIGFVLCSELWNKFFTVCGRVKRPRGVSEPRSSAKVTCYGPVCETSTQLHRHVLAPRNLAIYGFGGSEWAGQGVDSEMSQQANVRHIALWPEKVKYTCQYNKKTKEVITIALT